MQGNKTYKWTLAILSYHMRAIITRGFYIFYPIFTVVYNEELQTIYVLNKETLQFFSLKSAVYNQERVIIARVR